MNLEDEIEAELGIAIEKSGELADEIDPGAVDDHIDEIQSTVLEDVITDHLQFAIESTDDLQTEIMQRSRPATAVSIQPQIQRLVDDDVSSDLLFASRTSDELQKEVQREQHPNSIEPQIDEEFHGGIESHLRFASGKSGEPPVQIWRSEQQIRDFWLGVVEHAFERQQAAESSNIMPSVNLEDEIEARLGVAIDKTDELAHEVYPSATEENVIEIPSPPLEDFKITDHLQEIETTINERQQHAEPVDDDTESDLLFASGTSGTSQQEIQQQKQAVDPRLPQVERIVQSASSKSPSDNRTTDSWDVLIHAEFERQQPAVSSRPQLQRSNTLIHGVEPTSPKKTQIIASNFEYFFDDTTAFAQAKEPERMMARRRHGKREGDKYNVHDFYHTTGIIQSIARAEAFGHFTRLVIILQAVYFYFDAEYNLRKPGEAERVEYIVIDECFCLYFLIEILIRFLAFEKKRNCLRDVWFVFDASLVIMSLIESMYLVTGTESDSPFAKFPVLRLARLARLTRMARLMAYFPELSIMLDGCGNALRSIAGIAVLSMFLFFMFGIFFTQMAWSGRNWEVGKENNCYFWLDFSTMMAEVKCDPLFKPLDYYFGSNTRTLRTLYLSNIYMIQLFLEPDCANGIIMFFAICLFAIMYRWGLLWMMLGLLRRVFKSEYKKFRDRLVYAELEDMYRKMVRADAERQRGSEHQTNSFTRIWNDIKDVWHSPTTHRSDIDFYMRKVFNKVDDGDGKLSKLEFYEMIKHPLVIRAFELFDIKERHVRVLETTLFHSNRFAETDGRLERDPAAQARIRSESGNDIDFDHFINIVEFLRQGDRASVLDIVEMTNATNQSYLAMRKQIHKTAASLGLHEDTTFETCTYNALRRHIKAFDPIHCWTEVWSQKYNRYYYWNEETNKSTWILPST